MFSNLVAISNLSNYAQTSIGTAKFLYNSANYLFSPFSPSTVALSYFELELERMQVDRLIRWMGLFFENYESIEDNNESETKREYRKELYSVYKTIVSDYKQYQGWKKYNESIWILPYYRSKCTNELAKKIIADISLFNDGLSLFTKL
jgi:hypothetical protein